MTLPQHISELIDSYAEALARDVHKERDLVWEVRLIFRPGERPAWRCMASHMDYVTCLQRLSGTKYAPVGETTLMGAPLQGPEGTAA